MAWTTAFLALEPQPSSCLRQGGVGSKTSPFVDSRHHFVTVIMGFLWLVTHHNTDAESLGPCWGRAWKERWGGAVLGSHNILRAQPV